MVSTDVKFLGNNFLWCFVCPVICQFDNLWNTEVTFLEPREFSDWNLECALLIHTLPCYSIHLLSGVMVKRQSSNSTTLTFNAEISKKTFINEKRDALALQVATYLILYVVIYKWQLAAGSHCKMAVLYFSMATVEITLMHCYTNEPGIMSFFFFVAIPS